MKNMTYKKANSLRLSTLKKINKETKIQGHTCEIVSNLHHDLLIIENIIKKHEEINHNLSLLKIISK